MVRPAVLHRVLQTISRHNMLPPGARLIVAVSGGADSVCLLHVLKELAPACLVGIAHFNHKWRAEASDEDERFVAALASQFDLPFYRAEAKPVPGNLEQNARRARLAFFATLNATVALGHTRDDQAETVLFRFLRGSGLAGLAGIAPTANGIIRPLLDITRAEVEQFLRARNITWRDDATNLDPRFARNRIRHQLLPQLARDWNPKIAETLARLADLAHEEEKYWEAEIDRIELLARNNGIELPANLILSDACAARPHPENARRVAPPMRTDSDENTFHCGAGCQPADRLPIGPSGQSPDVCEASEPRHVFETGALPRAAARRLIRRAIALVKGDLRGIDFNHVESVLDLKRSLRLPGLTVTKSFDWIRFAAPVAIPAPVPLAITRPGVYLSPDGLTQICVEVAQPEPCATLRLEACPTCLPLQLRGWQPGDRYRPEGHSSDRKIQEMFQKARVPSWRRPSWPILKSRDKIVWARQFGVAAEFSGTLKILEIAVS
jgi:tRNA(Ile)-lysidine synthetase-like protein